MPNSVVKTHDDSSTLFSEKYGEHYHSIHGALSESYHVFIYSGLLLHQKRDLKILEMGFGTGINAFLTLLESNRKKIKIEYTGIELNPIKSDEVDSLINSNGLIKNNSVLFEQIHNVSWEKLNIISNHFALRKLNQDILNTTFDNEFDIIYFDAFSPNSQPNLWTTQIFKMMFKALKNNGILSTYCSKSSVRKNMESAGFEVKKRSGPLGKREIVMANKY